MGLRLVFVVDAAIGAAFGLGMLIAPDLVSRMFGVHLEAGGILVFRLFGAFIVGLAMMLWAARDATASVAGIAMTRGQGMADVLAAVISAVACVQGVMNAAGWSLVALFGLFAFARIWYGFLRAPAAAAG